MDPQEKDESQARLREEALARRMGEALDRIAGTGAGECPEAGLIAAYYERALQPEEISLWEGHFAGCSRCRKILAVLAASVDAPLAETEVARLGELVAAAARPAGGATPRPLKVVKSNRFDWRARWLAPALGVAAVFAVWFAMRAPWRAPGQGPTETLVAQAPKTEPLPGQERNARGLDQTTREEFKKAPESPVVAPPDRISEKKEPASSVPELAETNLAKGNKSLNELKTKAATAEARFDNKEESAAPLSAGSGPPAPPPVAAPAPQLQAASGESPGPPLNGRAMSNSPARDKQAAGGVARADAESKQQAAAEMVNRTQNVQTLSEAMGAATVEFVQAQAPSGKVVWRASPGGRIQKSTDGGSTWIMQASPSQQDWLSAAVISDTVCWLVGRNGSIARTADGEHWVQVAPPGAAAVSGRFPDWTGVTASSAVAATITSSGNQRFRTEDGGQTWRVQ